MTPPMPPEVARAFEELSGDVRPVLDTLRALIFATAEVEAEGAGPVEEALRWGQPAYIAPKGSTIRLGQAKSGEAALFVNCRTSLIEDFRAIAPAGSRFEGTRAVLFGPGAEIEKAALAVLIARALTYHRRKTAKR
ncbi:MAG TPA: hypothetical protein DIU07_14560 [Rhodobacteraceae bacterium]|nr:hypothetical protein [Paracoccaceae bacterium]